MSDYFEKVLVDDKLKNMVVIPIEGDLDVVTARQKGRLLAREVGFGDVDQVRIVTAISELARNVVLYAPSGVIKIGQFSEDCKTGLLVSASDNGPGVKDVNLALQDGYSTSGGLGNGLPGVRRLMDEIKIETSQGEGTQVIVKKWLR